MTNKENHICDDCIHLDVCEWGIIGQDAFICASFIDKNAVERPQGEWIFDSEFTMFGDPYGTYKCSCCGGHSSDKYSFCKDCGADMRGDNND